MGIFGAMTTAVSGLNVQSFALENISGNIANSQTTGFKKVETSFSDLVSEAAAGKQAAGSVGNNSRYTNTVQGDVKQSATPTHMAIRGDGYFVVQQRTGYFNNTAQFNSTDLYTRRGDFDVDREGYLVNGSGMYLKGIKIDGVTGNLSGNVPTVMKMDTSAIPAKSTSLVNYAVNLPVSPNTQNKLANPTLANSDLLSLSSATTSPYDVTKADLPNFIGQTISGGTVTVYDSVGTPQSLDLYWGKVSDGTTATPATTTNQWRLFYKSKDAATAANTDVVFKTVGDFSFNNTNGTLTNPTGGSQSFSPTINGVNIGTVQLNFPTGSLTNYYTPTGVAERASLSQNGYPPGERTGIEVTDSGRVQAVFSNNQRLDLFQISVVSFPGDNGLRRIDGNAWAATSESGAPVLGASGKIVGSSLEQSNVDISDEFTKMIITQQAYAANTKVVSTSNSMLEQTINMIR